MRNDMRTLFVNPTFRNAPRKRKRRRSTKRRNHGNTKDRTSYLRGKEAGMRMVLGPAMGPAPRQNMARLRRNAGVVPFIDNPLILNPRRRRRRTYRRNPAPTTWQGFFMALMLHTGGSGIGASANILGLNKIPNVWVRNLSRIGSAVASGFLPNAQLGGAAAGAFLYPVWQEIALYVLAPGGGDVEADIDTLAADLEDAINEADGDEEDEHWAAE